MKKEINGFKLLYLDEYYNNVSEFINRRMKDYRSREDYLQIIADGSSEEILVLFEKEDKTVMAVLDCVYLDSESENYLYVNIKSYDSDDLIEEYEIDLSVVDGRIEMDVEQSIIDLENI